MKSASYASWVAATPPEYFGYPDDDGHAPEGNGEGTPDWSAKGGEYIGNGYRALTDEELEDLPF